MKIQRDEARLQIERLTIALIATLLAAGCNDGSLPLNIEPPPGVPVTTIDIGELVIGVAGPGTFGRNPFAGRAASEFPPGSDHHVFAGLGLWLSARVDGDARSTITAGAVEYVAGTVGGEPADPRFRVYKVTDGDSPDAPDVVAWPADLGAPIDATGAPRVPASGQIVWTLYHDAEASAHTILHGDGLGAEVRQTLLGFGGSAPLRRSVVVRWHITNRSASAWDDLYVGFWADAELGGAFDDLCGSDSTLGLGYVYNAIDADSDYGAAIPAAGIALLGAATAQGELPFAPSFNVWRNGEDPETETQARNLLNARRLDGTAHPHRFLFPDDPTRTTPPPAEVDRTPGDKRMLMAAGPYSVAAGDSLVLEGLMLVSRADGVVPRLASVVQLRDDFATALESLADLGVIEPRVPRRLATRR
jgi:hypothetical protein